MRRSRRKGHSCDDPSAPDDAGQAANMNAAVRAAALRPHRSPLYFPSDEIQLGTTLN